LKTENHIFIQFKIGLALRMIIGANKALGKDETMKTSKKPLPEKSYGGISSTTGIRSATVSDIINGKSEPKATTLIYILDSLGASMSDFGKIFDSLSNRQVKEYILEITKKK
jgi:hypothetical protein